MEKLTLTEVQYVLRGVSEEVLKDVRISGGEKWETTKLFAAYSQNLHGAPTDIDAHHLICAALRELAVTWVLYFTEPAKYAEFLAQEGARREFYSCIEQAFAAKKEEA